MSRWLIGMSGDKDKMSEHLLKCEKQMVKRFADIKEIVMQDEIDELKEQLLNQQKIISGLMEGDECTKNT